MVCASIDATNISAHPTRTPRIRVSSERGNSRTSAISGSLPSGNFRQPPQPLRVPGSERAVAETPGPVVMSGAGEVHSSVAAEVEDVLNGDDGGFGNRGVGGADQTPGDVIGVFDAEVRLHRCT